jgi:hypothetical protein
MGTSNISGEQSNFKRSPCPSYAIDIAPSGFAFLIFLTLIMKIKPSLVPDFRHYFPTFPIDPYNGAANNT